MRSRRTCCQVHPCNPVELFNRGIQSAPFAQCGCSAARIFSTCDEADDGAANMPLPRHQRRVRWNRMYQLLAHDTAGDECWLGRRRRGLGLGGGRSCGCRRGGRLGKEWGGEREGGEGKGENAHGGIVEGGMRPLSCPEVVETPPQCT
jgi:hypothetical protein